MILKKDCYSRSFDWRLNISPQSDFLYLHDIYMTPTFFFQLQIIIFDSTSVILNFIFKSAYEG